MAKPYLSLADYFERTKRSRSEAAEAWGVTEATISRWISGTRKPRGYKAIQVAQDTRISLHRLIGGGREAA